MSIIELRQTSENDWKAKYEGNYGTYTIKITRKGGKTVRFSCTCPSDYYPCKHISMIEEAVAKKTGGRKKAEKRDETQVTELINDISADELRKFVAAQAKFNPELRNAIFLEFTAKIKTKNANKYSAVLREVLNSASVPMEDYYSGNYYSEEPTDIDELDQWLDKAEDYAKQKQYDEAILICKAVIEEFSLCLFENKFDDNLFFPDDYYSVPFDIIEKAAKHTDKKELFDYCRSEMKKKKYEDTDFCSSFHGLLGSLAPDVDPGAFLDMQDELLAAVPDKSSREAELILLRKIEFFQNLGNMEKALEIVEANIQISDFRLRAVENRIAQGNFSEAKKLINDYIAGKEGIENSYSSDEWHKLLLDIAQKEKDIPAIQSLAYGFIEERFDKEHFQIYKTAFNSGEWAAERDKLFLHYDSKCNNYFGFSNSAANLLVEENETERILLYIEQHLTLSSLETYHKFFSSLYPEKTVELFRQTLEQYAEKNIGRTHYEHILEVLRKMTRVKGGKKAASELVDNFKTRYKNRRAMIETLNRFQ